MERTAIISFLDFIVSREKAELLFKQSFSVSHYLGENTGFLGEDFGFLEASCRSEDWNHNNKNTKNCPVLFGFKKASDFVLKRHFNSYLSQR